MNTEWTQAMSPAAHAVVVFLLGALWATMGEYIGGARKFTMPFVFLALQAAGAAILSLRFGWNSTLALVVLYAALCIAEGLRARGQHRTSY